MLNIRFLEQRHFHGLQMIPLGKRTVGTQRVRRALSSNRAAGAAFQAFSGLPIRRELAPPDPVGRIGDNQVEEQAHVPGQEHLRRGGQQDRHETGLYRHPARRRRRGVADSWRVTDATSLLNDVPEPSTITLLVIGLAGLGIIRRRGTLPKPR